MKLSSRQWQNFFKQKRAVFGLVVLGFFFGLSLFAEFWSHENPFFMVWNGRPYLPSLINYSPQEFGVQDSFVMDYRQWLEAEKSQGHSVVAFFPPNRWGPYTQNSEILAEPSSQFWLGTDSLGRDVFARLIYGIRVSLAFGFTLWLCSFSIGILIGSVQGYFAGKTDFFVERFKELTEIIPLISVVILVNGLAKSQSFFVTIGVVMVFSWIGISSQVRAQFLSLRKREFCEASRACGATDGRIIFKLILPNALTPILTLTPFSIAGGIAILTTLDYLGYGLNPPTPSLGELLQQGRLYITRAPWLLEWPTFALASILISINLVGEALMKAFNPREYF